MELGIAEVELGIAGAAGLGRRANPVKRVRGLKPPRLVEVGIAEGEVGIAEGEATGLSTAEPGAARCNEEAGEDTRGAGQEETRIEPLEEPGREALVEPLVELCTEALVKEPLIEPLVELCTELCTVPLVEAVVEPLVEDTEATEL